MTPTTFSPCLVQRIERMAQSAPAPFGNLIGYYRNGTPKLNDEERQALRDLLPLDYMGSSEFEFGAVPKALVKLAKRDDLAVMEITVKGKPCDICIEPSLYAEVEEKEKVLYLLFPKGLVEPEKLCSYLGKMLKDQFAFRHQEMPRYSEGIFGEVAHARGANRRPLKKLEFRDGRISMWFDLDNLWVATTDIQQLKRLKMLLGHPNI